MRHFGLAGAFWRTPGAQSRESTISQLTEKEAVKGISQLGTAFALEESEQTLPASGSKIHT